MEENNETMNEFVNDENKNNEMAKEDIKATTTNSIPDELKPISMWGYFGYEILFAIPFIGLIVLIIFALGGTKNQNVQNFARSKFCLIIVALAIMGIAFLIIGVEAAVRALPNLRFNY